MFQCWFEIYSYIDLWEHTLWVLLLWRSFTKIGLVDYSLHFSLLHVISSRCQESQREAALLLGQFATTDPECKVGICTYSDALFYSLLAPSSLSSIGGCLEGFVSFFYFFSPFLVSFVNSSSLMISWAHHHCVFLFLLNCWQIHIMLVQVWHVRPHWQFMVASPFCYGWWLNVHVTASFV